MKELIYLLLTMVIALPVFSQTYQELRRNMVDQQLRERGISHLPTLTAMEKVERHRFVPAKYQASAYMDTPLPIGFNQTISQPYIVALMTQLLKPRPNDRILEIGTGSGYQAAVLAEIVAEVYTIEIVAELAEHSKKLLGNLGYRNVLVIVGDGYQGYREKAPYDCIIVTSAVEKIPTPLADQLREGGRMVIPIGEASSVQNLTLIEKEGGKLATTKIIPVRFVPFVRNKKKR